MRRMVAAFALAGLLALLSVGPVFAAQSDGEPTALVLRVQPPPKEGLDHRISATLTTVAGAPVSGATVSFYAVVELLGERSAFIGDGTTDATGTTAVPFSPRRADYRVVASYAGDGEFAGSRGEQDLRFPDDAVRPYEHVHGQHALLAPVRSFMPGAISVTVAVLWVGLVALAVSVVRAIRNDPGVSGQELSEQVEAFEEADR